MFSSAFAFLFLVLLVCSLNNEVALFCVCAVCFHFWWTRVSGFLVCILWSCFYFWLFCVQFSIPFKERPKKKTGHGKKKAEKGQTIHLAQLCSHIVFPILGGGLQKSYFCWKPYKNRILAYFEKRKSQKSGQCWVNNLSRHVAQHNWFLAQKMVLILSSFSFVCLSHSPCRKKKISENKQKGNFWTDFWFKLRQFLDRFLILQHIYIINLCGRLFKCLFSLSRSPKDAVFHRHTHRDPRARRARERERERGARSMDIAASDGPPWQVLTSCLLGRLSGNSFGSFSDASSKPNSLFLFLLILLLLLLLLLLLRLPLPLLLSLLLFYKSCSSPLPTRLVFFSPGERGTARTSEEPPQLSSRSGAACIQPWGWIVGFFLGFSAQSLSWWSPWSFLIGYKATQSHPASSDVHEDPQMTPNPAPEIPTKIFCPNTGL